MKKFLSVAMLATFLVSTNVNYTAAEMYETGEYITPDGVVEITNPNARYTQKPAENGKDYVGHWYSSTVISKGKVNIGTVNKDPSYSIFSFHIKDDTTDSNISTKNDVEIGPGEKYYTAVQNAPEGHNLIYKVNPNSEKTHHAPWGWTDR